MLCHIVGMLMKMVMQEKEWVTGKERGVTPDGGSALDWSKSISSIMTGNQYHELGLHIKWFSDCVYLFNDMRDDVIN